jgi:hypothetical protein
MTTTELLLTQFFLGFCVGIAATIACMIIMDSSIIDQKERELE